METNFFSANATRRRPIRNSPQRASVLAAGALMVLGMFAVGVPGVGANTTINGISFVHKGGNATYVKVQVVGSMRWWAGPEVRDTDGAWQWMNMPGTADQTFDASYPIEPGHKVQFRLNYKGNYLVSCWFTHPQGVESCDGTQNFTVTFHPSGNSDAVNVNLDANHAVGIVYFNAVARGWFREMPKAANGSYSMQIHVPSGLVLQFHAQSSVRGDQNNEWADSLCYRWPTVTAVACPTWPSPTAYGPHHADGDSGWKVLEAWTSPGNNSVVKSVEVRFDGGPFQQMTPIRDGVWRYSNAPETGSHIVQFRASDFSGGQGCNYEQAWYWPYVGPFSPSVGASRQVQFGEMSGNDHWLQTNAFSQTPIIAMEASVNGGAFQSLPYRSWCEWAGSLNAPQGSRVVFRAFYADLQSQDSAPVTWPPGPSPAPFSPFFTMVKGNEFWIQANAYPKAEVTAVDFHADGGVGFQAWYPLRLQSWGGWAGSYHLPDGAIVQLRATNRAGATGLSQCYMWIPPSANGADAAPFDCAHPPSRFKATFSGVKGNEWWAETKVASTEQLSNVDARIGCTGDWHAMTLRNWGAWAGSFHIPSGSKVDFRARSAVSGEIRYSGGYTWPAATPTAGC
jgi:hypothetical protein